MSPTLHKLYLRHYKQGLYDCAYITRLAGIQTVCPGMPPMSMEQAVIRLYLWDEPELITLMLAGD